MELHLVRVQFLRLRPLLNHLVAAYIPLLLDLPQLFLPVKLFLHL
jgi:hypothetical protein